MTIASLLLEWYKENARVLPWRSVPDPYKVWISEIMLQQTQVDTVMPYYERWMARFPDLPTLAAASEQDVLNCWEGLGYYSRARNLHKAACMLVDSYGAIFPTEVNELRMLPGIGRYTAGAIASIAFGRDEPALDGNIRRVYARLFNLEVSLGTTEAESRLWLIAQEQLPQGRAGDFNQALMDLGASICTPQNPRCLLCPLSELCQARGLGLQQERPVRKQKPKVPHYTVTAAVISRDGRVLIAKRPAKGLLGGMWEFPGGKLQEDDADLQACLVREIREELAADIQVGAPFGVYRHAYTHFKITLHAFLCELLDGQQPQALQHASIHWIRLNALEDFPMGKVDRQIATRLMMEANGSAKGLV